MHLRTGSRDHICGSSDESDHSSQQDVEESENTSADGFVTQANSESREMP
jgi:hypothetical protein